MTKKILTVPNPQLLVVSEEVKDFGTPLECVVQDMQEIVREKDGRGFAAIQMGVPLRLFVMEYNRGLLTVINPKVVRESREERDSIEGCFSLPGRDFRVSRKAWITLEFQLLNGESKTKRFAGKDAITAQHEFHHPNGILISEGEEV